MYYDKDELAILKVNQIRAQYGFPNFYSQKLGKHYLLNNKLADEKEIQTVSLELDDEIEEAFEFAKTSPFLDKKHLYTSIYSD